MPTGYTYSSFVSALAEHLVMNTTDADFLAILPSIIDAGELRIYRDLDPLFTRRSHQSNIGLTGTATDAILYLPGETIDVRDIWIHIPGAFGTQRVRLDRRDESWINDFWPDRTLKAMPRFYSVIGGDYGPQVSCMALLIAPVPDQTYTLTMNDIFRPAALSASNTTTFLSLQYPDLFLYSCLIYASGWQKNYGSTSDDPQNAVSWREQYDKALSGARTEEGRRKGRMWVDRASQSAPPITAP